MKKIYILVILILVSNVIALEKLTSYVNDEAKVIDSNYNSLITSKLENLKRDTSVEMAVAIVKSLDGRTKEDYAISLVHDKLGDKEKDNGILIFLAVDDREYRIEVGYGLEGTLNDAKVGRIGRNMAVDFKAGNYQEGILMGVNEIDAILRNQTYEETTINKSNEYIPLIVMIIFFLGMILMGVINHYSGKINRKNNPFKEDKDFKAARNASILFGGFGRGGMGGGFGGFGGGGFGGGGAGGRFKNVI